MLKAPTGKSLWDAEAASSVAGSGAEDFDEVEVVFVVVVVCEVVDEDGDEEVDDDVADDVVVVAGACDSASPVLVPSATLDGTLLEPEVSVPDDGLAAPEGQS